MPYNLLGKLIPILGFLLSIATTAPAQNLSRFGLRVGPRLNLNSVNPDGERMEGINSLTGAITAVYDLRLRNNLCFEAGLGYGYNRQKIRFSMPMSGFDPLALNNLRGAEFEFTQKYELPYIGINLAMGYSFALKPRHRLDIMGGVSGMWYLRAYNRMGVLDIAYQEDNRTDFKGVTLLQLYESFGDGEPSTTPTNGKFGTPTPNFDLYAIFRREVNTYVFNEINIGLRISCAAYLNGTSDLEYYYLKTIDGPKKLETYTDRNVGFQLTIGGSF